MTVPVRVVLADAHPVVRDGLAALLAVIDGIEVVGVAGSGREAVRAAVTLAPDVVVMDISMPDLDGVAATREIRRSAPGGGVLMLTMLDDEESVRAALQAGAAG
jgi:DNA-binding NarL/FixJ family response regulator